MIQNKDIDETDQAMVSKMQNVQANKKSNADVLIKKTGKVFNSQDVRNIVSRLIGAKDVETIKETLV